MLIPSRMQPHRVNGPSIRCSAVAAHRETDRIRRSTRPSFPSLSWARNDSVPESVPKPVRTAKRVTGSSHSSSAYRSSRSVFRLPIAHGACEDAEVLTGSLNLLIAAEVTGHYRDSTTLPFAWLSHPERIHVPVVCNRIRRCGSRFKLVMHCKTASPVIETIQHRAAAAPVPAFFTSGAGAVQLREVCWYHLSSRST